MGQPLGRGEREREVVGEALADKLTRVANAGWPLSVGEIEREVAEVLGGAYERYVGQGAVDIERRRADAVRERQTASAAKLAREREERNALAIEAERSLLQSPAAGGWECVVCSQPGNTGEQCVMCRADRVRVEDVEAHASRSAVATRALTAGLVLARTGSTPLPVARDEAQTTPSSPGPNQKRVAAL